MSQTQTSPRTAVAGLPGAEVIGGIRRLLIAAALAAFVYPAFMTSSRGYCPGGVDGSGGFIDASGQPVDEAVTCIQLNLEPSPLMYVGIALIVYLGVGRIRNASDELTALRMLRRSAVAVLVLVAVAIVVSQVWFFLVPIHDFSGESWTVFSPFPFGNIHVDISPWETS